jgi:hypothetical protein
MFRDLVLSLVSMFVIEPFEAEIGAKLKAAAAPQAIVAELRGCAGTATPILVDKVFADPVWGITSLVGVATGMMDAQKLVAEAVPACGPVLTRLRPFLNGAAA